MHRVLWEAYRWPGMLVVYPVPHCKGLRYKWSTLVHGFSQRGSMATAWVWTVWEGLGRGVDAALSVSTEPLLVRTFPALHASLERRKVVLGLVS